VQTSLKNLIWYLVAADVKATAETQPEAPSNENRNLHQVFDRQTKRDEHSRPGEALPSPLRLVKR
jgi:hypothetical protein